jgi:N-acetylmuramoyl-L-alanine amidase
MKIARRSVLLALVLCARQGLAAPRAGGGRVEPGYEALAGWAQASGLALSWVQHDHTVQLSNRSWKILLTADSRQAEFNGVQVWLSFPVMVRTGSAYLARLDVEQTLEPLLSPPRDSSRARLKLVCLDPGHGGKDPGYCVGGNQEKRYTLLLAEEVRRELKRTGFKVIMTRGSDRFRDLGYRPALANRRRADLFLSLHFNASETSRQTVQGAQVFCLTPPGASSTNAGGEGGGGGWFPGSRSNSRNVLLAYELQKALTGELGAEDRGMRRARFAVLREAWMPAVLIEAGFMSHPVEGKKILTAAYRARMARAIVDGLLAYQRIVER